MGSNRRENLVAGAADQALTAWLGRLQDASFSRASRALRTAYPPPRRMTGPQLAGYLERRTYALASSTRPDGRAHAAPTLVSLYGEAFWLPGPRDCQEPYVLATGSILKQRHRPCGSWRAVQMHDGLSARIADLDVLDLTAVGRPEHIHEPTLLPTAQHQKVPGDGAK